MRLTTVLAIIFAILVAYMVFPSHDDRRRHRERATSSYRGGDAASASAAAPWSPGSTTAGQTSGDPPAPASGDCRQIFFQGTAPTVPAAQQKGAVSLCNDAFATLDSPATLTPLWSAEHLTAASVAVARQTPRDDEFHPDDRLDPSARAELDDYRRSGYDRGHLSPSGDMPGPQAQAQSFALSNIAPQNPTLNRGTWADLETDVRDAAQDEGEAWVVTGLLFRGSSLLRVGGRVFVPTDYWKAVYVPGRGAMVAIATNDEQRTWTIETVAQFRSDQGIDPFPSLSQQDSVTRLVLEHHGR